MKIKNREQRTIQSQIEVRSEGESRIVSGYASTFDDYDLGDYVERVDQSAFNRTLKNQADVRFLFDHSGLPLARTKSGTLKLEVDEKGLKYEAQLAGDSNLARDLMSALKRGDLDQSSFGFFVHRDKWGKDSASGKPLRTLLEVELFDVSAVTYPANPATNVSLRNALNEEEKLKELFTTQEEIEGMIKKLEKMLNEKKESNKQENNKEEEENNMESEDSTNDSDSPNSKSEEVKEDSEQSQELVISESERERIIKLLED